MICSTRIRLIITNVLYFYTEFQGPQSKCYILSIMTRSHIFVNYVFIWKYTFCSVLCYVPPSLCNGPCNGFEIIWSMFSYNRYSLYTVVVYTLLYMQYHHEICIEKAVQRMKVWENAFSSSSRYISNQLYVKIFTIM